MRELLAGMFIGLAAAISLARADPIRIVAAENFYGDIARQIGGRDVVVSSVLSNPDQDPHLFEASPSVGRDIAAAQIVILNGIDYDPWMEKLLAAARSGNRKTIVAAELAGRKTGDNPHIWYDLAAIGALAKELAATLSAADPAHKSDYERRLAAFDVSLQPIGATVAQLRQQAAGAPVAATEPVFGYMLDALGMEVKNRGFQLAVMNNTEPAASDVARFEDDLKSHKVKLLIYNSQATDVIADRMQKIARAAGIPVVAVTETEPAGTDYQAWIIGELDEINRALLKPSP
jgi:zinc/manganese transport system substrate-binding protein